MGGCGDTDGPPSIVLISLDTFRGDRLGAFGNPDGLTPNLDAFAKEAVVFDHVYSQAVQTNPSHTSLFTSHYPSEEVDTDGGTHVPDEMPLLAQLLSLYDYHTGAFVGGGDLSPYRGLDKGFDVYESTSDFGSLYHSGPKALAWLATLSDDRPFFAFIHGYDTHSRYLKPTPYGYAYSDARTSGVAQDAVRTATERIVDGVVYPDASALMTAYAQLLRPRSPEGRARFAAMWPGEKDTITPDDRALVEDVYDGAVSYADTMFGLLVAALQDRGVLDDAYVILLSDHGEGLGEHGLFGHCCEADEEETHVPLLVRAPGGAGGGRRVTGFVELVDVMPTILELAGATAPAGIQGHSLAPALRGEPFEGRPYAFTEGSELMRLVTMRGPAGRLTFTGLSVNSPLLPDVVAAARLDGPAFTTTEGMPDATRAAMRADLVAWLRRLTTLGTAPADRGEMPAALRQSLRDHGYWEVPAAAEGQGAPVAGAGGAAGAGGMAGPASAGHTVGAGGTAGPAGKP
jgi:arylsulfatase A-like enzyme